MRRESKAVERSVEAKADFVTERDIERIKPIHSRLVEELSNLDYVIP